MVRGVFKNCSYEFLPDKPISYEEELSKNSIRLIQNNSTLVNFFFQKESGFFLGDGAFTKLSNLEIIINCHDCIPLIVLGDQFCGAVHIGWRNLYLDICSNILKVLERENINLKELKFVIGPHIQQESMEYNKESLWISRKNYDKTAFLKKGNKTYFSMKKILKNTLFSWGVEEGQIIDTNIDTFTNSNYASYRKNKEKTNTNFFIVKIS